MSETVERLKQRLEAQERSAMQAMNGWEEKSVENHDRERWANYYAGQASGLRIALNEIEALTK